MEPIYKLLGESFEELENVSTSHNPVIASRRSSRLTYDYGRGSSAWSNLQFFLENPSGKKDKFLEFIIESSEELSIYRCLGSPLRTNIHAVMYSLGNEWTFPASLGEVINPFYFREWRKNLQDIPRIILLDINSDSCYGAICSLIGGLKRRVKFRFERHFDSLSK